MTIYRAVKKRQKIKSYYTSDNDEYGEISITADEVVLDDDPIDTGLIDLDDNPIYRFPETVKIGFHNTDDN